MIGTPHVGSVMIGILPISHGQSVRYNRPIMWNPPKWDTTNHGSVFFVFSIRIFSLVCFQILFFATFVQIANIIALRFLSPASTYLQCLYSFFYSLQVWNHQKCFGRMLPSAFLLLILLTAASIMLVAILSLNITVVLLLAVAASKLFPTLVSPVFILLPPNATLWSLLSVATVVLLLSAASKLFPTLVMLVTILLLQFHVPISLLDAFNVLDTGLKSSALF